MWLFAALVPGHFIGIGPENEIAMHKTALSGTVTLV